MIASRLFFLSLLITIKASQLPLLDIKIPPNYSGDFSDIFTTTPKNFEFAYEKNLKYVGTEIPYLKLHRYKTINPKPRRRDITVVTQVSIDRLSLLRDFVDAWDGSVSCSVYISKFDDIRRLNEWIDKITIGEGTLIISVLFGLNFIADASKEYEWHPYDFMYPINALRNVAIDAASTDLIFSLDVDFLISKDAFAYLTSDEMYSRMRKTSSSTAFVLSAFELLTTYGYTLPYDRGQLDNMCENGKVIPFHSRLLIEPEHLNPVRMKDWCSGRILNYHVKITEIQFLTNFTQWFTAKDIYPVAKDKNTVEKHYEPYYIASRKQLPHFDESFRGYSFNKRQHNIILQYIGYEFLVLPNVFVIHRWHPISDSKKSLSGLVKQTNSLTYKTFLAKTMRKYRGEIEPTRGNFISQDFS